MSKSVRRDRHRQATIEEILQIAVDVMAEDGVGALSLAEVARRMGIRPPSLYVYFDSKLALFDALFEAGNIRLTQAVETAVADIADPLDALRAGSVAYVRWSIENPVFAQLMFWRPVPGFTPSEKAYAPSIRLVERVREVLGAAVEAGRLDASATSDDAIALFTVLTAGVVSQQLANDPGGSMADGRFTRLQPTVVDMFLARYKEKPS